MNKYIMLSLVGMMFVGCSESVRHVEDCIADVRKEYGKEMDNPNNEFQIFIGCEQFKNDSKQLLEAIKQYKNSSK